MYNGKSDFEQLHVWKNALVYATVLIDISENMSTDRRHFRLVEQLESSSTSVAMNIAEGKGQSTSRQYLKYLHYARGSLYESITLLELFFAKDWISEDQYVNAKDLSQTVAKQLNGLIKSIKGRSTKRLPKS